MRIVNHLPDLIKAKQERYLKENNKELTELLIAVGIGINPTTLSHYKNLKKASINWEVWVKLAEYFEVSGHEIFDIVPDDE